MEEEDIDDELALEELETREVMNCGGQWEVAKTTASCQAQPKHTTPHQLNSDKKRASSDNFSVPPPVRVRLRLN